MKTYKEEIEKNRLVIEYDQSAESPREWSNLGYFITVDRNFTCPDKNETMLSIVKETGDEATSQEDHIKRIKKAVNDLGEKCLAVFPVVKYEHGNVVYRLGSRKGFDYSNNGFYIVTKKSAEELGTPKESFEKVISQEIEIYTQWANGEVYGFTLYDEKGEQEDSCWGFYDIEDIRAYLPDEWKNEDLNDYMI